MLVNDDMSHQSQLLNITFLGYTVTNIVILINYVKDTVFEKEKKIYRTFLGVQGLRVHTSTAGGGDFIPAWGTKLSHAL